MGDFEKAITLLPEGLARSLRQVSAEEMRKTQEIHLHRGGLLTLSMGESEKTVDAVGVVSDIVGPLTVYCDVSDIEKTFLKACDYSVHSHMCELQEGFVTAKNGIRVGVAGTAVTENGKVTAMRDISSLCIRVAGRHDGCAASLHDFFCGRIPSILIAGVPSSGKTSFLRDVARMLSLPPFRYRVTVVDERGEIAGTGGLENADVLRCIPKPVGILQAVRTLAPDVIVVDELGTLAEVEAMTENLHAGVPAIATAHCSDLKEALCRPAVRLALERNIFEKIVFLRGREEAGQIREIVEVADIEMDGFFGAHVCGNDNRYFCTEGKATEGAGTVGSRDTAS